jgi:hypothetical protein
MVGERLLAGLGAAPQTMLAARFPSYSAFQYPHNPAHYRHNLLIYAVVACCLYFDQVFFDSHFRCRGLIDRVFQLHPFANNHDDYCIDIRTKRMRGPTTHALKNPSASVTLS